MMITLTVIFPNGKNSDIEDAINSANNPKWCAENALFTIDGISFFPSYDINKKPLVFAVNNSRTSNKIIYRFEDDAIIQSSMSDYSFNKFEKGLKSNKNRLIEETREVLANA